MQEEVTVVLDLCGREAVVGVARGTAVLAERRFAGRGAAERVMDEMEAAMAAAAVGMGEVRGVVVVRGPGSFTGVRVGLAVAKGLAEGLGVGVVGVSRLAVLAVGDDEVVAVLEAGRGEWFWGRYAGGRCVGEGVGTAEEVRAMGVEVVVGEVGSGWEREREVSVGAMVRVAEGQVAEDAMGVEGLYLRRTAEELLERQAAHRRRREGA